ncbi:hypothetical protein BDW22DRAFT_1356180 [Trametopsis cervina]|nr:hypothetical protein BDW22DRAFT_1356180 [Trametopsis cervina]
MSTFSLPLDLSSIFPCPMWIFEDRLPILPADRIDKLINKWAPTGSFSQDSESESPRYEFPDDSGNDDTIYGCELKENWLREYYDSHEVLQQYRFSADSNTKARTFVLVLNDLTWPVIPKYSQAQVSEISKFTGNEPRWWGPIYRWQL